MTGERPHHADDDLGPPDAAAAPDDAEGSRPRLLGRYTLRRPLARGGQGEILLAMQDEPRRPVVIKRLRGRLDDPRAVARFAREAAALGRLEHPGIPRILEAALDDDGRPLLVLEHVDGEPLDAWASRARPCLRERVVLLARVADAVQHAHDRGVVHRDLKPDHVLVPADGRPRLLDFGIARLLHDEGATRLTRDGEVIGSPGWLAPEQVDGLPADARTDVHGLGLLAYALLSGRPAWPADGATLEVLRAVREDEPPRLGRLDPRLRGDLECVVARALEKDPARRYASAAAFARDLRRHLAHETLEARPLGAGRRALRLARRHRRAAATLLVVLLALGLGTAAALTGRARARTAARELDEQSAAIERLADGRRLRELLAAADALWPAWPEQADVMSRWIAAADELAARLPVHRATLERWRAGGAADTVDDDAALRWRLDAQSALVADLERLVARPANGDDASPLHTRPTLAGLRARRDLARRARERSVEAHRDAWDAAVEDVARSPRYDGLHLDPQLDLLPLGADPRSGLHEFAHLPSGTPATRGPDGVLQVRDHTGVVLVLIPGGRVRVGVQRDDPAAPRHDPRASEYEVPVSEVRLDPYFLGKFELTQAQWARATGAWPAYYHAGWGQGAVRITARHPVESVSHAEARVALRTLGLELPTEAQWEHGARAGSDAPYLAGDGPADLAGHANLFDRTAARQDRGWDGRAHELPFDDGFQLHAPVGSLAPNAFGLHDVIGNVSELTRDLRLPYDMPARPGDGLRAARTSHDEALGFVVRGLSHADQPAAARVAWRSTIGTHGRSAQAGLRAARAVWPATGDP